MYIRNGQAINVNKQQVIEGITYPPASLQNKATQERLGISFVASQPKKDSRWYFNSSDGTATQKPLEMLRPMVLQEIKRTRQNALDAVLAKSSGLGKVYDENVAAVNAIKAGNGDAVVMNSGKTATAHVAAMAANMGMTEEAFSAHISQEAADAATKADEIENEYLRVAYTLTPNASFEEIQTLSSDFSAYCEARANPKEAS